MEDGDTCWDVITVDLYEYHLVDGFDHVLVIADGFGRGVEFVACKGTPTSEEILDHIFHRVIRGHRCTPRMIRSDAGSVFISEICKQFWRAYGTELRHSTAEHHSTAGLAERANAVLHDLLIAHRLSSGDPRWYLYLGHIENCYNSLINESTGFSPTFIEYGRDARLPLDIAFYGVHRHFEVTEEYIKQHLTRMHEVWDAVRAKLGLNALARKRATDSHRDTQLKFEVHDRVLLRRRPGHPKWEEPFHGPYRISEVLENDNYRLRDLHSRRLLDVVHVERLVPYPSFTNHGDAAPEEGDAFVQRIIGRRQCATGEGFEYKVRWRGTTRKEDEWLTLDALRNCHDLVREYNTTIDPLDNPPPKPALEPTHPESKVSDGAFANNGPHFRRHPDRTPQPAPATADAATHEHDTPLSPGSSDSDSSDSEHENHSHDHHTAMSDAALEPADNIGRVQFVIDKLADIRRKGAGYEVLAHWCDTITPLPALTPRWRAAVRDRLHAQHPTLDLPADASLGLAPSEFDTVDAILDVRMDGGMPVAKVRWQPSWVLRSNLPSALRADAQALIDSLRVTQPAPSTSHDSASRALSTAEVSALAIIQDSALSFLASKHRTYLPTAAASGSVKAARDIGAGLQFRVQQGKALRWVPSSDLAPAEQRKARALLQSHDIATPLDLL
jgi:hypothetical protein